ncbi:MAG TPA: hypothetical protein DCS93_31735 [Microscillaceae bacterium]|nr:hypothetical protein [Microscillaceae bacterium]
MIRLHIYILIFLTTWLIGQDALAQAQVPVKPSQQGLRVTSQVPTRAATNVNITSQIVLEFDQTIQIGSGNLVIQKKQDQAPVQIIEAHSSQVQTRGNRLIVNLVVPLAYSTAYTIQLDKGFVKDLTGHNFTGISPQKPWYFTTQKFTKKKQLKVFPNPAIDHFNVQLTGVSIKVARIELYNLQGELLKAQLLKPIKSSDLEKKVWINDLPQGTYLLKVITPNYIMEKQLYKQ